jgi:hypothetical protein
MLFLEKIKTKYQKLINNGKVAAISLDARLRYIVMATSGIKIRLFAKGNFFVLGLNKYRKRYKENR